jgi:hypothetical protein
METKRTPTFSRAVLSVIGVVRVAYGVHALLAPEAMGRRQLAPLCHGKADPRLSLRGFGGQLLVVGASTLAAAHTACLARPVVALNLGIDAADLAAGALEWHARGQVDRTVAGSLAINLLGAAATTAALAGLSRS